MLTVYIPTFNRGRRLSDNVNLLFSEIVELGLQTKISILVGDNASDDDTPTVCKLAIQTAKNKGVVFDYFRNQTNLGFGGNIKAGFSRVTTEWIMFLSDDDVLFRGALKQICLDLIAVKPDLALYNFDQFPYGHQNPLIKETTVHIINKDFSQLASLFSWPKLTGVIVRCRQPHETDNFLNSLLSPMRHYPHVILAILRFHTGKVLYKSRTFIAAPDIDHLEHINFPWHTTAYLVAELNKCKSVLGLNNTSFNQQIETLPKINVIDSSVTHLFLYYCGKARITTSLKTMLWNNVLRFITCRGTSEDGLSLNSSSPRFYGKLLLLPLICILSFTLLPVIGIKRKLMPEGF